jgi:hypothetical protein
VLGAPAQNGDTVQTERQNRQLDPPQRKGPQPFRELSGTRDAIEQGEDPEAPENHHGLTVSDAEQNQTRRNASNAPAPTPMAIARAESLPSWRQIYPARIVKPISKTLDCTPTYNPPPAT